jgi:hypothetical protein
MSVVVGIRESKCGTSTDSGRLPKPCVYRFAPGWNGMMTSLVVKIKFILQRDLKKGLYDKKSFRFSRMRFCGIMVCE